MKDMNLDVVEKKCTFRGGLENATQPDNFII